MRQAKRKGREMTRKDYELIAKVLRENQDFDGVVSPHAQIAVALATELSKENPRFSPARFLEACDVSPSEIAFEEIFG